MEDRKCYRTACPVTGKTVVCHHTQNGQYYCPRCARKINEYNPGLITFPKLPDKKENERKV